jgi:hypothetical protein
MQSEHKLSSVLAISTIVTAHKVRSWVLHLFLSTGPDGLRRKGFEILGSSSAVWNCTVLSLKYLYFPDTSQRERDRERCKRLAKIIAEADS